MQMAPLGHLGWWHQHDCQIYSDSLPQEILHTVDPAYLNNNTTVENQTPTSELDNSTSCSSIHAHTTNGIYPDKVNNTVQQQEQAQHCLA